MEVIRARLAGFCMGVGLALKKLDDLLTQDSVRPTFMLGPIIHNPQVLESYAQRGVGLAKTAQDVPSGARVVIRAHGIPADEERHLLGRGVEVVDATCPKVKRAQLLIEEQAKAGRRLLLFGEDDHPEVRGLLSYAGDEAFVFETPEELAAHPLDPAVRYFLAAQTTQDRKGFEQIKADLSQRLVEIQHDEHEVILTTVHVHLDHHNCLEVTIVKGRASQVRELAEKLIALRGVKNGNLTMSSTGGHLH